MRGEALQRVKDLLPSQHRKSQFIRVHHLVFTLALAEEKPAHGPVDWMSYHREKLAIPALVLK